MDWPTKRPLMVVLTGTKSAPCVGGVYGVTKWPTTLLGVLQNRGPRKLLVLCRFRIPKKRSAFVRNRFLLGPIPKTGPARPELARG